jgi:hypothetical protein
LFSLADATPLARDCFAAFSIDTAMYSRQTIRVYGKLICHFPIGKVRLVANY